MSRLDAFEGLPDDDAMGELASVKIDAHVDHFGPDTFNAIGAIGAMLCGLMGPTKVLGARDADDLSRARVLVVCKDLAFSMTPDVADRIAGCLPEDAEDNIRGAFEALTECAEMARKGLPLND